MTNLKEPSESDYQICVFEWAKLTENRCPSLKYMFATLNGIKLTIGQAVKAKKQGNRKGPSDIVLPCWSHDGKYCGLYIELKKKKGFKISPEQVEFLEFVRSQKYRGEICHGSTEAINLIKEHLGIL